MVEGRGSPIVQSLVDQLIYFQSRRDIKMVNGGIQPLSILISEATIEQYSAGKSPWKDSYGISHISNQKFCALCWLRNKWDLPNK